MWMCTLLLPAAGSRRIGAIGDGIGEEVVPKASGARRSVSTPSDQIRFPVRISIDAALLKLNPAANTTAARTAAMRRDSLSMSADGSEIKRLS